MRYISYMLCYLLSVSMLSSCAQESKKKSDLTPKSIYEVTLETIQENQAKYGLKGSVKSVHQKEYLLDKDAEIDLKAYTPVQLSDEADYALFATAGMAKDCTLTFNKTGQLLYRMAHGNRFNSKVVETDTLHYTEGGRLTDAENDLKGEDFAMYTHTHYVYDEEGRLIQQRINGDQSVRDYTYNESKRQVRVVTYDAGTFTFDTMHTYDVFGRVIETITYNEAGNVELRLETLYDKAGNIEKQIQYFPDGETNVLKAPESDHVKVYAQYDARGNYIKRIIMDPNGSPVMRERQFTYYP